MFNSIHNMGLGVDVVEIERFRKWHTLSDKQLARIFSEQEIAYCRSIPTLFASRCAVRYAARESLYKALSSLCPDVQPMPFLSLCRACEIVISERGPHWNLNTNLLMHQYGIMLVSTYTVSLSHTATTAFATTLIWT